MAENKCVSFERMNMSVCLLAQPKGYALRVFVDFYIRAYEETWQANCAVLTRTAKAGWVRSPSCRKYDARAEARSRFGRDRSCQCRVSWIRVEAL